MIFNENDLVCVATTPPAPNEHLDGRFGYISGPGYIPKDEQQVHYPVAILSEDGLEEIAVIATGYLGYDTSEEARCAFEAYQQTLDEIEREADQRQKQYRMVINHLARKYGITPDEVRGVYKAVLHYENYYQEHVA